MNKSKYLFGLLLISLWLTGCNYAIGSKLCENRRGKSNIKSDSVELTCLVRNVFKWHQSDTTGPDFSYKFNHPNDSVYTGIDWELHNERMKALRETDFFTEEFLSNYQEIALRMDKAMKESDSSWRNTGDVPSFEPEADHWCSCQDCPDIYWNIITISDFNFGSDSVSFNWTWGNNFGFTKEKNKANAKKENGVWKLNYLAGFELNDYGKISDDVEQDDK